MALVLDTHATLWYLEKSNRLSAKALGAIEATSDSGENLFVPSISLVEIQYLVEKGRVPETALRLLLAALATTSSDLTVASLDLSVIRKLPEVNRSIVPDMPDRIIAATALALGVPLVTRDSRILRSGIPCIW